ncbi:flagellar hook protein FlgE, partial [Gammaproteobacteria bacterium]|nr:flagellar hook protein FlgE [Gammaproteobacteria bacterium]
NAVGKGVAVVGVNQSFTQGNISFTDNVLDMAINGNGFFVLDEGGSNVYSRAGNFQVDRNGFVVNADDNRLQVFNTTDAGVVTGGTGDLRIDTSLIQPNATTAVDIVANLDSRNAVPITPWGGPFDAFAAIPTAPSPDMFNASTSLTVFDSLGNSHIQSIYFVKTGTANQWDVHTLIDGVSEVSQTIEFDSSGQIDTTTFPAVLNHPAWAPLDANGVANGATSPQAFSLDLSTVSQFGSEFSVSDINQDGFTTGQLRGVEVDDSGIVFARFTNGQARALGQIALANFSNTSDLQPLGGSAWAETFASGQAILTAPGTGGLGVVQSGALEDSNVEVTQQLVDMIVAQRNFQANAKVIQTEDTITQTVINLR